MLKNIPITELKPYPNNPRKNDHAVDAVAASIREFGFKVPLVIDKDGVIVAGHTRYKAAQKLGLKELPCIVADDLTDDQIKAFRLADNKTAELAEWDFELLDLELDDIELDMSQFGFELAEDDEPAEIVEDEAPKKVETRCKLGDIWQLGKHRLMCGSSTDPKNIKALMNGEMAKMLFTSPPYSDMREYEGGKDLCVENLAQFIACYRPYTDYQCVNLGIQRKDHEIVPYWDEYTKAAHESGYKMLAWNIWDKLNCGSIGQQSAFFPLRHEFVFVYGTEFFEINLTWEKKPENIHGPRKRAVRQADGTFVTSTTGDETHPYKQMESVLPLYAELGDIRALHPATFPVGLPAEYIKAMTQKGDAVIEPFGGSGTTLIACEELNRRCFIMELEPKYCDVIIQRWENFTGETAVLLNG